MIVERNRSRATFVFIGLRTAACIMTLLLAGRTAWPDSLHSHIDSARVYRNLGDLNGAEREYLAALKGARSSEGRSIDVAGAFAMLGVFYQDIGRFLEAEVCFRKSLSVLTRANGPGDLSQVPVISHLAWLYVESGRTKDAKRLHIEEWVRRLDHSRSEYLPAMLESVGGLYALQGDFTSADRAFRKDFDLLAERGALVSVDMASALNNLGFVQLKAGRYEDALKSFSSAMPLWSRLSPPGDLQGEITRVGLAETYDHLGRYEDSSELFAQTIPVFEKQCGPRSLRTADVLNNYARVLRHQKRKTEAKEVSDRARRIRDESAGQSWSHDSIDVHDLK